LTDTFVHSKKNTPVNESVEIKGVICVKICKRGIFVDINELAAIISATQ